MLKLKILFFSISLVATAYSSTISYKIVSKEKITSVVFKGVYESKKAHLTLVLANQWSASYAVC
jgi:hypothetical protein